MSARGWTQPPALKLHERIRLTPGGLVRVIVRVTPCAAYYGVESVSTYTVMDRKTGEDREITRTAMKMEAISAYSFVERVGEAS